MPGTVKTPLHDRKRLPQMYAINGLAMLLPEASSSKPDIQLDRLGACRQAKSGVDFMSGSILDPCWIHFKQPTLKQTGAGILTPHSQAEGGQTMGESRTG